MNTPKSMRSNTKNINKSILTMRPNRFGSYYCPGSAYSPQRIAECCDIYLNFQQNHGRCPTILEYMSVAKIGSKDLARKLINKVKYGIDIPVVERGHRKKGVFSLKNAPVELELELYALYLDWPSRPVRSYIAHFKQKYNYSISFGTIVAWFKRNNKHKGVFVSKTCFFSELKYTKSNVMYYNECKKYFSGIYHNNLTFTDEKSFILHDLFKLRVRRDPITGVSHDCTTPIGINPRKRHNIICTIRPFTTSFSKKH